MSKQVRWQIPFVSVGGTHYRIDIYDEQDGSWSGVQTLIGGETPFATSEDDSDDYFAPIRTQSGTIEVCTLMPDGNYITLDDLLPANNIARPVKLWRILGGGAAGVLEWQGFLSCEAYDQDYTGIPQIIQLPVISLLEAMASVQLDPTISTGLQPIYVCLPDILKEIDRQSGIECFTHINYSRTDYRIISKYIDMTVMFEQKEYNNENSTTYIVSGLSAKDALERLCTYMGWIAREKGTEIYLQRIGEGIGMYREAIADFPGIAEEESLTEAGIAATFANKWRGTDHKRTVSQGAKSVEVIARMEDYEMNIELPDCPTGDVQQYTDTVFKTVKSSGGPYGHGISISAICNKDSDFINICDFLCYQMTNTARIGNVTTVENVLSCALVNPSANIYGQYYSGERNPVFYNQYIGSFLAKIKEGENDYKDGLYIVGMREAYFYNAISDTNHLFQIRSNISSAFINGTLKFKCNAITIFSGDVGRVWGVNLSLYIHICLKFGDMYWNGSSWVSSFASFNCYENELTIPVNTRLKGEVFIRLYGYMDDHIIPSDGVQGFASDMFISELSLDYEPPQSDIATDRSENHYFRLLGTNFRDEISVGTELASMLNNQPSPSLIMNDINNPMKVLEYSTSAEDPSIVESRRPEVDLLNRLAIYYSESRQRLELEMAHIETPALPLLKLQGISPDNRVYLPLSESRDWQTDVCKLTCFEMPQEPAES